MINPKTTMSFFTAHDPLAALNACSAAVMDVVQALAANNPRTGAPPGVVRNRFRPQNLA